MFYRGLWGIMEKKMETTIIGFRDLGFRVWGVGFRWTAHPVIVTMGDNRDYIRVLLYSYCTTITGWGVLLMSNLSYRGVTPNEKPLQCIGCRD